MVINYSRSWHKKHRALICGCCHYGVDKFVLLNLTCFVLKSKISFFRLFSSKISFFRQNIGFNLLWYMPIAKKKKKKISMVKNNNRSMTFKIQNTCIGRQQHEHHLRTKSGYWIAPPATMFACPLRPACLYSPRKLKYLPVLAALSPTKTCMCQKLHAEWQETCDHMYDENERQQKHHTCTSVGWTIAIHGNWC